MRRGPRHLSQPSHLQSSLQFLLVYWTKMFASYFFFHHLCMFGARKMPFHVEETPVSDTKITRANCATSESWPKSRFDNARPTFAVLGFEMLDVALPFIAGLTWSFVLVTFNNFSFRHLCKSIVDEWKRCVSERQPRDDESTGNGTKRIRMLRLALYRVRLATAVFNFLHKRIRCSAKT